MLFKKKYKFDESNTLLLLADPVSIERREEVEKKINIYIEDIKNNKTEYAKMAVMFTANTTDTFNIDEDFWQIISLLIELAKYGSLGMGIKSMVESMLQGANLKQATSEGAQYFLFYLVVQFYPILFDTFKFKRYR